MELNFLNYFQQLADSLTPDDETIKKLKALKKIVLKCKKNNKKLIIIGNGGSSAISSHVSVDFTKNANIRAINFNEADLITCFANDYGHENWMKYALKFYCDKGDITIFISSSGKSLNILNAANFLNKNNYEFITFTGMSKENPLIQSNPEGLNFHVNSMAYNHIENTHQAWLLSIVDACIGSHIYSADKNR